MKITLLTAAIGAGFASQAHAIVYTFGPGDSTSAGAGLPVTLSTAFPNFSLPVDLNKDGTTDFTLSSTSSGIFIDGGISNQNHTFFGYAVSTPPGTPVNTTNLKLTSGLVPIAQITSPNTITTKFTAGVPGLIVDEFAVGPTEYLGYVEGTYNSSDNSSVASFTVTDFGYDSRAIPEPSSLALLAAGGVGVLAFRRQRKAARA